MGFSPHRVNGFSLEKGSIWITERGQLSDIIVTDNDWLAPLSLTTLALKKPHERRTACLYLVHRKCRRPAWKRTFFISAKCCTADIVFHRQRKRPSRILLHTFLKLGPRVNSFLWGSFTTSKTLTVVSFFSFLYSVSAWINRFLDPLRASNLPKGALFFFYVWTKPKGLLTSPLQLYWCTSNLMLFPAKSFLFKGGSLVCASVCEKWFY